MTIDEERISNGPYQFYHQHPQHPMSSSSMVGPIDDSDGEDEQDRWGRPAKKAQLRLISALLRDIPEDDADASGIRYALPTAWFEAWEDYCTFPQSRSDPGPIDIGLIEGGAGDTGHSNAMLVSGQVWNLLVSWYGMRDEEEASIAFVDKIESATEEIKIAYKLGLEDPNYTTIPIDGKVADLYGKLVRLALEHQATKIRKKNTDTTTSSSFEGWRILGSTKDDDLWLDDLIAQESLVQAGLAREDLIYCLDSEAYKSQKDGIIY